ncbi:MAG: DUF2184 domain-containing protein [Hellea sp.]|nr:DUF2184 domain-containing protein [Hellea sp.]
MNLDNMNLNNSALAQFRSQLVKFETESLEEDFDDIQYAELIPVDTSGPEWIKGITYRSLEKVGQAKWVSGGAQDVPNADILSKDSNTDIELAAIGYAYTLEEIQQSAMHGFPLDSGRLSAARRAAEEFTDNLALSGDQNKGMEGLFNSSSVTPFAAPQTFDDATLDQALAMVNSGLVGIGGDLTRSRYPRDTVLLPASTLTKLASKRVESTHETFLSYLQKYNLYTVRTGNPLTIRDVSGLETAGAGATKRAVFYRRDPNVLKFHMPMPHKFLPVQQVIMEFKVPGIFRIGGTEIRRPDAIGYQDGV